MDLKDIRRQRLRAIMLDKYEGRQAVLANALEVAPDYVSRMLSEPTKKGHKRIGEEFAREIEGKLRLPAGYLDNSLAPDPMTISKALNRVGEPKTRLYGHDVTEEAVMFAKEWERLPPSLRAQVQALVHMMVAELVRADRGSPPAKAPGPKSQGHKQQRHQHS